MTAVAATAAVVAAADTDHQLICPLNTTPAPKVHMSLSPAQWNLPCYLCHAVLLLQLLCSRLVYLPNSGPDLDSHSPMSARHGWLGLDVFPS